MLSGLYAGLCHVFLVILVRQLFEGEGEVT